MTFNVKISLFYRFDESEIFKVTAKLLITSMVLFAMVNCDINIVRLLEKAALLQKYNSESEPMAG